MSDVDIQEDIQKLLVTKLVDGGDVSEYDELVERGFTQDSVSSIYRPTFTFIHDYRAQYGTVPERADLARRIPDIDGILAEEAPRASVPALYDELINQSLRSDAYEHLSEIAERWNANASGLDILDLITESGKSLQAKFASTRSEVFSFKDLSSVLIEDYQKILEDISPGIPIPFEFIQAEMRGWSPAEITTVAAKTGVGKTWFLLLALDAAIHGDPHRQQRMEDIPPFTDDMRSEHAASVLFVSLEMPAIAIARRLAAIITKTSFPKIRSGKLSDDERDRYFSYLQSMTSGNDDIAQVGERVFIVGPGAATSPDQIAALAEKYEVDMVMVDGFYYMDGPGEKRWEKVESNMQSMRLHTLTSNRHYILATQFRRDARTLSSSDVDSLAFSASIGHDSNNIVALVQPDSMEAANQLQMTLVKIRDGNPGQPYRYMWDVERMDYRQLGMVADTDFGSSSGSQY